MHGLMIMMLICEASIISQLLIYYDFIIRFFNILEIITIKLSSNSKIIFINIIRILFVNILSYILIKSFILSCY